MMLIRGEGEAAGRVTAGSLGRKACREFILKIYNNETGVSVWMVICVYILKAKMLLLK